MSRYRRAKVPGGVYFFTVTLANRRARYLIEHIDHLRNSYRAVRQVLPFETLAVCVLPEHLHAVWRLPADDSDYSSRWQRIKAQFSKSLPFTDARSASKRRKGEKGIWQRRFWEHLIRDERDLQRHIDYVHYNPVKHGLVGRVVDWPYSSFHREVRRGVLTVEWAGGVARDDPVGGFGEL